MACKNRYSGSVDKCKNIAQHNYDLVENNINEITDVKIDGNLLGVIDNTFVSPLTDEEICKYLKALKNVERSTFVNWSSRGTKEAKTALKKAEDALCKNLKKPTCEESLADDPDLQAAKAECDNDPTKTWSMSRCECRANSSEEVAAQPEKEIYGCLDPTATNYYCIKNDCVDNKPPEGIVDVTCEYEQELAVENKYLFCNADECTNETPGERVTPTNDIASWMNNGALDNDHIYDVKAGIKKVIEKVIPKGIFLKSKKGFYTRPLSKQLINEFANALTVTVFNTKFNKDNSYKTFPYTKVTVYGGNSQPMGQFRIEPNKDRNGESDSIKEITMRDSSTTLNNRFREEVGTEILNPNHESGMIKLFGPGGDFEDVRFTVKDGKIVTEDIKEGLGLVLQEEPIGLAKLLK